MSKADFAAEVAAQTVCYSSVMNTRVCVAIPMDAPDKSFHTVMDRSRKHRLVATHIHGLDGEAFAFELEFTPVDAVAFGGKSDA